MIQQCSATLLKEICGLKRKKLFNFKILKVQHQCDKENWFFPSSIKFSNLCNSSANSSLEIFHF